MKKPEGLFKFFYLKQSLMHQLKKASVAFPVGAAPLHCKWRKRDLKWNVRMKRLHEAATNQLLGWMWASLSCFGLSAAAVPWEKCCQQGFGEPLCLSQGADLAWSLASTSATNLCCLSISLPQALSPQLGPQNVEICSLCALEEQVCFWTLGSLGLICN